MWWLAPNAPFEWNLSTIQNDLRGSRGNGWSDDDIRTNITKRYTDSECIFGPYTSDSIMHMPIPQAWYTINGQPSLGMFHERNCLFFCLPILCDGNRYTSRGSSNREWSQLSTIPLSSTTFFSSRCTSNWIRYYFFYFVDQSYIWIKPKGISRCRSWCGCWHR